MKVHGSIQGRHVCILPEALYESVPCMVVDAAASIQLDIDNCTNIMTIYLYASM